ncbi:hypothetical protein HNR27_002757 [Ornithinibacillus bavariensis]
MDITVPKNRKPKDFVQDTIIIMVEGVHHQAVVHHQMVVHPQE